MEKQIKLFGKIDIQKRDYLGYLTLIKRVLMLKIAQLIYPIFKNRSTYKNLWLIGERGDDARDNGYHFYRYMLEHHPEENVRFLITSNSVDKGRITKLGRSTINTNSLKHYIALFSAKHLIGTHTGKTLYVGLKQQLNRIGVQLSAKQTFLQHGVIKADIQSLHYPHTDVDLFISGAKAEFDYLRTTYGYPDGRIQYTGLARFDNLHNITASKTILLMPTWRYWLQYADEKMFMESDYFKAFHGLLTDKRLHVLLKQAKTQLIFYPHYEVQRFIHLFKDTALPENIIIAEKEKYDVQDLLKQSGMLITDYSSVYFDFSYMRKPVIYFQFDRERFYNDHYNSGYLNELTDGFGAVYQDVDNLLTGVDIIVNNGMKPDAIYLERMKKFFSLYDTNNCKRIYEAICNL